MDALLGACIAFLLAIAAPAYADPITWSFTGSQGVATGPGFSGNSRTSTSDGITLTMTAWGYTAGLDGHAFSEAALGRWETGLGVCNQTEGCSDTSNQVDNNGDDDWVLFVFGTPIDITSVRIDPLGTWDRDVSYWTGNVSTPIDLTGLKYTGLAGLGFTARRDQLYTEGLNSLDVPITTGPVNAMLFGARNEASTTETDRFMIASITGERLQSVPTPSTLLLVGIGLGIVVARRQPGRRNR